MEKLDSKKLQDALASVSAAYADKEIRNKHFAEKVIEARQNLALREQKQQDSSSKALITAGAGAYFGAALGVGAAAGPAGIIAAGGAATAMAAREMYQKAQLAAQEKTLEKARADRDTDNVGAIIEQEKGGKFKQFADGVKDKVLRHDDKAAEIAFILKDAIENKDDKTFNEVISANFSKDKNAAFVDYLARKGMDKDSPASDVISTIQSQRAVLTDIELKKEIDAALFSNDATKVTQKNVSQSVEATATTNKNEPVLDLGSGIKTQQQQDQSRIIADAMPKTATQVSEEEAQRQATTTFEKIVEVAAPVANARIKDGQEQTLNEKVGATVEAVTMINPNDIKGSINELKKESQNFISDVKATASVKELGSENVDKENTGSQIQNQSNNLSDAKNKSVLQNPIADINQTTQQTASTGKENATEAGVTHYQWTDDRYEFTAHYKELEKAIIAADNLNGPIRFNGFDKNSNIVSHVEKIDDQWQETNLRTGEIQKHASSQEKNAPEVAAVNVPVVDSPLSATQDKANVIEADSSEINSIEPAIEQEKTESTEAGKWARKAAEQINNENLVAVENLQVQEKSGGNELDDDDIFSDRSKPVEPTRIIPKDIESSYLKVGDKYHYPSKPELQAFEDKGNKLETKSNSQSVAADLVKIANARGWNDLNVKGTEEFKRQVWLEASLQGMNVKGYKPTDADKALLAKKHQEVPVNTVEKTAPEQVAKSVKKPEQQATTPPKKVNEWQARADALRNESQRSAVKKHPDLVGAFAIIKAAELLAKTRFTEIKDREKFVGLTRETLAKQIEVSKSVPEVKVMARQQTQAKEQKQERSSDREVAR